MWYWREYDYRTVPSRKFSIGEIFWVSRYGWHGMTFGNDLAKASRPGMVLKESNNPEPVMMAPGTTKKHNESKNFFKPQNIELTDGFIKNGIYAIRFKRPVEREYIENMLGKISEQDIEDLNKIVYKRKRRK